MPVPQHIDYCGNCARRAFEDWRGWPDRNAVPLLPRFNWQLQFCGTCRKRWPLSNERLAWLDHRETEDTGMPDYWVLTICDDTECDHAHLRPYYAEGRCSRCEGPTIVSEMKYPDGTHRFYDNCRLCGVIPLSESC